MNGRVKSRTIGYLASCLLLLLISSVVTAQSGGPVLAILQVDDTHYPEVKVLVSAADANGIPLAGLGADAFLLAEDGSPVTVSSVTSVTGGAPLYLALALDTSGSMDGGPLQTTTEAARSLVQGLTPEDQSGLILFSDEVNTAVPLGSNPNAVISALQGLRAVGDTSLYDAAHAGVTMLQQVPSGRRAVVLFTDGEDTDSDLTLEDAVDTAQRFSVPLYVVGYGPRIKPAILSRLAQRTGGAFFQAPQLQDIPTAFAQVMNVLRQAYQIDYIGSSQVDGRDHELRVALTLAGDSTEEVSRVVARPGNLAAAVDIQGIPNRDIAEAVWASLGQTPLDATTLLVGGNVTLLPNPTGAGQLDSVKFDLSGDPLAELAGPPFSFQWDASQVDPGIYTLGAEMVDHVGNRAENELQIAVIPAAHVAFTSPGFQEEVVDVVPVSLVVSSISPIQDVVLSLDGQELQWFSGEPYEYQWTTWQVEQGAHTLSAQLNTTEGYSTISELPLTVGQHVVAHLTEPQNGDSVKGNVRLVADIQSDARVRDVVFYVGNQEVARMDSAPYQASIHSGDYPPGDYEMRVVASNYADMSGEDRITVQMTPVTRTSALMVALILGLLLLLIIPVVFVSRRRRKDREESMQQEVMIPAMPAPPAAPMPVGWLTLVEGEAGENQYPIQPGENHIGRNRDFADIWVTDLSVSRRHSVILADTDGVFYYDLNPDNPSMINDRPVVGTTDLQDDDRIQIGGVVFLFSTQFGG